MATSAGKAATAAVVSVQQPHHSTVMHRRVRGGAELARDGGGFDGDDGDVDGGIVVAVVLVVSWRGGS
nr:hypothetical protein [Tanacetum cinerariifolium]